MSTYRSPSRTRHAQEQNHMADTKEEEVSNGCWLQKLKPWIADFPLKRAPSCLSPRHPPIPSPHDLSPFPPPTRHAALSTGWLVGSWGAVLKWELCRLHLFAWNGWVHPDLKSIPTALSEAGMKCWSIGTPDT